MIPPPLSSKNLTVSRFYDHWVFLLYLLLVFAGVISICGSTGSFDTTSLFEVGSRPTKQLFWIGISLVCAFLLLFLDSDFFNSFAPTIYLLVILLLIATLILAPDIKGSRSWIPIGSFRLQPAEFAKLATGLMLASLMDRNDFRLSGWRAYLKVFAIILLPALIILFQREAGSALVFSVFFLVLYRQGLPSIYLGVGGLAILLFVVLLYSAEMLWGATRVNYFLGATIISIASLVILYRQIPPKRRPHVRRILTASAIIYVITLTVGLFVPIDQSYTAMGILLGIFFYLGFLSLNFLSRRYFYTFLFIIFAIIYASSVSFVYENVLQPHQQDRIAVALGIKQDTQGAGYNVNQAKIAIGSGGFSGKGFMKGTQTKLNYVPEQDTDFIFCTIGEEYGFLGSVALLLLYLLLLLRLLILAERQPTRFGRVYGYSVAFILFFHWMINVGMVLGLVPVVGIPLPFLSYGGSSMLSSTLLLFLFLLIDRDNKRFPAYKKGR